MVEERHWGITLWKPFTYTMGGVGGHPSTPFCSFFPPWLLSFFANLQLTAYESRGESIKLPVLLWITYKHLLWKNMKWANSHYWTKQEDFKTNGFRLLIKWLETCLYRKMQAGFLSLTRVTRTFCLHLVTFKKWEDRLSFDVARQPDWPGVQSCR